MGKCVNNPEFNKTIDTFTNYLLDDVAVLADKITECLENPKEYAKVDDFLNTFQNKMTEVVQVEDKAPIECRIVLNDLNMTKIMEKCVEKQERSPNSNEAEQLFKELKEKEEKRQNLFSILKTEQPDKAKLLEQVLLPPGWLQSGPAAIKDIHIRFKTQQQNTEVLLQKDGAKFLEFIKSINKTQQEIDKLPKEDRIHKIKEVIKGVLIDLSQFANPSKVSQVNMSNTKDNILGLKDEVTPLLEKKPQESQRVVQEISEAADQIQVINKVWRRNDEEGREILKQRVEGIAHCMAKLVNYVALISKNK